MLLSHLCQPHELSLFMVGDLKSRFSVECALTSASAEGLPGPHPEFSSLRVLLPTCPPQTRPLSQTALLFQFLLAPEWGTSLAGQPTELFQQESDILLHKSGLPHPLDTTKSGILQSLLIHCVSEFILPLPNMSCLSPPGCVYV